MMKKLAMVAIALTVLAVPILLLKKTTAENDSDKLYDTSDYLADDSL